MIGEQRRWHEISWLKMMMSKERERQKRKTPTVETQAKRIDETSWDRSKKGGEEGSQSFGSDGFAFKFARSLFARF